MKRQKRGNPKLVERTKPCIRRMRITVRRVVELFATYPDRAVMFREYPFLEEEEDLQQALRYAAVTVDDQLVNIHLVA
jgi:uncharacterized protein (DUF433 family)